MPSYSIICVSIPKSSSHVLRHEPRVFIKMTPEGVSPPTGVCLF